MEVTVSTARLIETSWKSKPSWNCSSGFTTEIQLEPRTLKRILVRVYPALYNSYWCGSWRQYRLCKTQLSYDFGDDVAAKLRKSLNPNWIYSDWLFFCGILMQGGMCLQQRLKTLRPILCITKTIQFQSYHQDSHTYLGMCVKQGLNSRQRNSSLLCLVLSFFLQKQQ